MATRSFTYQFTCIQCGNETVRDCTPGGVKPTLCSNACKVARHRAMNPDRLARYRDAERGKAEASRRLTCCRGCGLPVPPRRRLCEPCRARAREDISRLCRACGVVQIGKGAQRCEPCREKAALSRKSRSKRKEVETGERAARRSLRKAKLRGVTVEPVNPLKVLARDKWKCQLCGVGTPSRLRGSYDDRAPEVDHIIPIAEGGEHSYRNVQCACRRCNLAKSSTPLGQMRLFG